MTVVTDLARPAVVEAPGPAPRRRGTSGFNTVSPREKVVRYVLLAFVLLITIGPFLWQLSTSLKGAGEDVYSQVPRLLPSQPTFAHYKEVTDTIPVWDYARNSLVVAFFVVFGNVVGASLAGFALSRLQFRGRRIVLGLFLATLVLPGEVTIISQYVTVREFGLANTLFGVALPGMIGALNVLLMYNAFRSLPVEVDQAAVVDGANAWQRLIYIGLPSVRGTISVVAIFAFIGAWDDFLWPLIVLTDPNKYTLTVGLQYLSGTFTNNPRLIAAGTMIAFIPIVIVFATLQRFFFKGVEEGAVKG
ncbi:carbohydrate ABC transporter permease [Kribbella sp. NPDC026611]|uniref:carbohydrate ABC transporter permease n=1 Tax=Kribbella sp. NPDC026611 TaxID=3154911 RepID=UPI0033FBF4D0